MPAKIRVNITIDPETLRLADRAAGRRRISRSEFIRTAVREMARNHKLESQEEASKKRRWEAYEGLRRIARKLGDWPAEKIVHDWRYRLVDKK
jgi:Arc/MetJ-type ribon-helix-helix transcriptional regulator